jgi:hypothetical protein
MAVPQPCDAAAPGSAALRPRAAHGNALALVVQLLAAAVDGQPGGQRCQQRAVKEHIVDALDEGLRGVGYVRRARCQSDQLSAPVWRASRACLLHTPTGRQSHQEEALQVQPGRHAGAALALHVPVAARPEHR